MLSVPRIVEKWHRVRQPSLTMRCIYIPAYWLLWWHEPHRAHFILDHKRCFDYCWNLLWISCKVENAGYLFPAHAGAPLKMLRADNAAKTKSPKNSRTCTSFEWYICPPHLERLDLQPVPVIPDKCRIFKKLSCPWLFRYGWLALHLLISDHSFTKVRERASPGKWCSKF